MTTFTVPLGIHLTSRRLGHGYARANVICNCLVGLREEGPASRLARLASRHRLNMEALAE